MPEYCNNISFDCRRNCKTNGNVFDRHAGERIIQTHAHTTTLTYVIQSLYFTRTHTERNIHHLDESGRERGNVWVPAPSVRLLAGVNNNRSASVWLNEKLVACLRRGEIKHSFSLMCAACKLNRFKSSGIGKHLQRDVCLSIKAKIGFFPFCVRLFHVCVRILGLRLFSWQSDCSYLLVQSLFLALYGI